MYDIDELFGMVNKKYPYFFAPGTLRSFHQTMNSFKWKHYNGYSMMYAYSYEYNSSGKVKRGLDFLIAKDDSNFIARIIVNINYYGNRTIDGYTKIAIELYEAEIKRYKEYEENEEQIRRNKINLPGHETLLETMEHKDVPEDN